MIRANPHLLPARVTNNVYSDSITTIRELCAVACIPYQYSGGDQPFVGVARGTGNLRAVDSNNHRVYVVDREQFAAVTPQEEALRVLEVVAHAFHDYAARECVRGLFI
jgi:hypothetical protein